MNNSARSVHSYVRMIVEESQQVKQVVPRAVSGGPRPLKAWNANDAIQSALQDQATIHRNFCARDIARHVRGKERSEFGNIA